MDHHRDESEENILKDIIHGPEEDVTSHFLNNSDQGDESLNQRDGSGEAEAWGGGETGGFDEGREAEQGEGSGGTLNNTNSGEVHIYIYELIKTLFYACI